MRSVIPCPSPNGTNVERLYIVRDRLALDAAMDPGASSDAYEELAKFLQENLSPDVLSEAETLLRRFVDKSGGTDDEPSAISGRPGAAESSGAVAMDELRRRVAVGAKIRAGKAQARQFLFDRQFPNASRIRIVG
jgi:hypothetical protein